MISFTSLLRHNIVTKDELPVNTRQYRYPPYRKAEIKKANKNRYNPTFKIIDPLWIIPKKEDSKGNKRWRLVIDYRKLNEKTIGDAYPLPFITDILDQLGGAKYFSIFDLASSFHQIEMNLKDQQKTAFTTPHGHYEFNRMPFGLKNAPATFQHLMDLALTELQGAELFVYLDDIVIYSRSLVAHASKFKRLAERLRQANLTLQTDKCECLRTEVRYLGHIILADGVQPNPQNIEAVRSFQFQKRKRILKNACPHSTVILRKYFKNIPLTCSNIARIFIRLLERFLKYCRNLATSVQNIINAILLQYSYFIVILL